MAKKKTTPKKKVTPAPKKDELVKVLMLRDMTLGGKDLPCGTKQSIPAKAAGLWSAFSRQYVKIL